MTKQKNSGIAVDPTTINEFMNSLQRLFKIGIYYPSGHATLDKATDRFLRLLRALAGDQPEVTITLQGDQLAVSELPLDSDLSFVREFASILTNLGIIAISFSREISREELHTFIRKMLAFRSQVQKTRSFTQIEIAEFPLSVTVRLKEFLARKDASISDDHSGEAAENLEQFIESLVSYGLSTSEIEQCKTLLDSLPERLSKSQMPLTDLPFASWDDVARLLARAIRAGQSPPEELKKHESIHTNINALAAILKKLERETTDATSRETINLLISIIRKPLTTEASTSETDSAQVHRVFPDTPHFSVEQIQEYTTKNRLHPRILKNIPEASPAHETLSIVLQLARHEQSLANQARMQQMIRELISGPFQEKTWAILCGGLQTCIADGKQPRIAAMMRMIADPLRRSPHANTLYLLLLTTRLCDKQQAKRLWPYAVNELLACGSSADEQAFVALCRFAARFPPTEMAAGLEELRNLDAFQNNTIAPDIFPGLPSDCYPLFAFLMKTEIESFVGERILGGLRRRPPEWLMKATCRFLDLSKQEHSLFLYSYLRQASEKVIPAVLKTTAARIVTEGLGTLSQDKRDETWVPEVIAALPGFPAEQIRPVLEQIASDKKLLFIHEWPTECRKAAEQALIDSRRRR